MRKIIVSLAALLGGMYYSAASVTVQGWWHYGEVGDYYADSSPNARRFASAFSRSGSGNAGVTVSPLGAGGPLGTTGWTSTSSLFWNTLHGDAAAMWGAGGNPGYNPPATNYVIELWCLPVWPGTWTGGGTGQPWLFCSGSSSGVKFQLTNDGVGTMAISARIISPGGDIIIGDPWVVDTNHWNHLAIVNDNGTQTFYVNGIQHGAPNAGDATTPAGDIYAGGSPGTTPTFAGYLDELRISTFAAGQFSVTDLLTRALSPNIISQPQSASVWNGGAAPFSVAVALDTSTTYQWQRVGTGNIGGANASEYYLNTVTAPDNGAQFDCVLNNFTGTATTSSNATLTVVPVNPDNVAAYQNAVKAESSLVAYYTADSNTGTTLTDTKGSNNGTLEGTASWDGRTTRAFGVRSLRLKNTADGDVQIPANPAFEFGTSSGGNGTIEAIVYLDTAFGPGNETLLAQAYDFDSGVYYQILASPDGTSLIYSNATEALTWAVSPPLLGRQAHVALVFNNTTTVTAYADGASLGAKTQSGFGSANGAPVWIGSAGLNSTGSGKWSGTIDEVALYASALSANTIAIHNSKFLYGTNTAAPTITGPPATGTKTLLAGGRASFTVQVAGTAPLAYQWTTNGIPIPGANSSTLTLSPTTVGMSSPTYGVTVSNPYGTNNSPTFGLTFIAPPDTYSTMVMADNPMAYWRFDETSGTTAFDVAGGHDATLTGSYSLGAAALPKMSDNAVRLTGGYAEVPFSAALNPATAFSVEFWCQPDEQTIYVPMSSQYRSGSARLGWAFYTENDADSFETHLGNANGVAFYCYGGGPVPLPGQYYHVVEVWDGAGNSYLYAENQLVGHNTQVASGGTYTPNPSAPLEIGVRNGGSFPWMGEMDEVAIYNYALTEQQISNHWSIKFQRASITTSPVGVTTNEGGTVTLTAVAAGFPNTYQWYCGSTPLESLQQNTDTTAHYPQGVTSPTLVISQVVPGAYPAGDAGQYHVVVDNPLGGATSGNASVQIIADTTPPVVTSVQALGTPNTPNNPAGGTSPYLVKVLFNKRVLAGTGTFAISGTTLGAPMLLQDVRASVLGADWREVIIPTSGLTPGSSYTLHVSAVKDQTVAGNTIVTTDVTFRAPTLTQGSVVWDYYYLGTTTGNGIVSDLTGNANFPNAPMTNSYSSTFDSTPLTGGDLVNVAPFGSLGERYGASLSGWITPTVTTNYYFFIASDDASELDLSTDDSPTNAVSIAVCSQYTGAFAEPGAENTSAPQSLVAGRKYFIRALQVEGGGGDFVKVAWRMEGDTTAATSLKPIPGSYLSSYAPGQISFNPPIYSGGVLTISWNGTATLLQSTNVTLPLSQWTTAATASPYQVTPATSGARMFYRLRQ